LQLRKEGRIELVASFGADRAEHAILIVDVADKHGLAKCHCCTDMKGASDMAGVSIKIPGTAGVAEAKAARLSQAVEWHLNLAAAPSEKEGCGRGA